eukprot:3330305-Rhodomonas_salina.2
MPLLSDQGQGIQNPWPTESAYVPAAHCVHAVEPISEKLPGSQKVQLCDAGSALKEPGAQGVAAAAPVGQKLPGSQITHSSALVIETRSGFVRRPAGHGSGTEAPFLPAEQASHSALAVSAAKLPGAHAVGKAAPPGHDEPAGQSKQSGKPSPSVRFAYWPGTHAAGSSRIDPTGHSFPRLHRMHSALPATPWKVPAGHGSHEPCPSLGAWLPAGHGVGRKLPAAHA